MTKIRLNQILTTSEDFNTKVIAELKKYFKNAEWLDENNAYMDFNTIFFLLDSYYGTRFVRFDSEEAFLKYFRVKLADLLPDIYAKQQVFIKNELAKYLSEASNRAVVINTDNTNYRESDNSSKNGSSSSPMDQVITDASEIANAPLTSANLAHIKVVDSYNGTNRQENVNFISDLKRTLNSDFSLRINDFLTELAPLFVTIVSVKMTEPAADNTRRGWIFRNGYSVHDVDYLGTDNQLEIKRQVAILDKKIAAIDPSGDEERIAAIEKQAAENTAAIKANSDAIADVKTGAYITSGEGISVSTVGDMTSIALAEQIYGGVYVFNDKTGGRAIFDIDAEQGVVKYQYGELLTGRNLTKDSNIMSIMRRLDELEARPQAVAKVFFAQGELKFFNTKAEADTFVTKFKLVLGTDYKICNQSEILGTGQVGALVGSGIIEKTNIKKFGLDGQNIICGDSGYRANIQGVTGGGYYFNGSGKWTIGVDKPIAFKPQYREVFYIEFLRDVFKDLSNI